MRRADTGRVDGLQDGHTPRHRSRLLATSAGLIAVPVVALALAGSISSPELSGTEVRTQAAPSSTVPVVGREAVPAPQRSVVPKGVAVVAPPTTTTTTTAPPPPPTTEAPPAPEADPEPAPADTPEPVAVTVAPAPSDPPPAPTPAPAPAPAGSVSANLDAIAQCESGGNPDAYNPAGYYGAFQFSLATWWGLGFTGDPRDYTYAEQKYGAIALYNRSGYSPWPACARSLGLI